MISLFESKTPKIEILPVYLDTRGCFLTPPFGFFESCSETAKNEASGESTLAKKKFYGVLEDSPLLEQCANYFPDEY